MTRWIYRRRSGVRFGKWIFGYERRDYRLTVSIAWPTVYRDPCSSDECPQR